MHGIPPLGKLKKQEAIKPKIKPDKVKLMRGIFEDKSALPDSFKPKISEHSLCPANEKQFENGERRLELGTAFPIGGGKSKNGNGTNQIGPRL